MDSTVKGQMELNETSTNHPNEAGRNPYLTMLAQLRERRRLKKLRQLNFLERSGVPTEDTRILEGLNESRY